MKNIQKIIATFTIALLFSGTILAQEVVVSADDFKSASKGAIIVDAAVGEYATMHVQDAIHIPHTELYKEPIADGMIKEPAALAKYFGEKGITPDAKVIIYDDGSQKYNSRVYWVLKYLGATDVHLLHKDMNDWRKARIRLTRSPKSLGSKTFTPDLQKNLLATSGEVMSAIDDANTVIVDSRTAGEYAGKEKESKGHIKSAVNINYEDMLDDKGAFLSKDQIISNAKAKGVTADKNIILYCKTSIRAATNFVALKEIAGFDNVKVYDGAYLEWLKKHPDLIVK